MKKRLFVIAIGGTGARVLRSLVMLMAAGEFADRDIVPVIVDFDCNNEDAHMAVDTLNSYRRIHDGAVSTESEDSFVRGFFSANLRTISGDWGFNLRFPQAHYTFAELIGYNQLTQDNLPLKHAIESLYGEDTGRDSRLGLEICLGFGGDASLGRIGFEYGIECEGFQRLLTQITPNDEIAIVGSSFAGSGPAGICSFLRGIKNGLNVRTAVVLLDPYFVLGLPMSTNIFDEKSECFRNFYHRCGLSSLAEATYYVSTEARTMLNVDDRRQHNDANIVELMGALAIKRFSENSTERGEFDIFQNTEHRLTIDDFERPYGDLSIYSHSIRDLASLAVSSYWLFQNCENGWRRLSSIINTSNADNNNVVTEIRNFADMFVRWWKEIQSDDSSDGCRIDIFDFDAPNMNDIIRYHNLPANHGVFGILLNWQNIMSEVFYRSIKDNAYSRNTLPLNDLLRLMYEAGLTVTDRLLN